MIGWRFMKKKNLSSRSLFARKREGEEKGEEKMEGNEKERERERERGTEREREKRYQGAKLVRFRRCGDAYNAKNPVIWVWNLGFGVWGLGFGVWGLGCGVFKGSGFRVQDSGVLNLRRN